jgi:phosphoribosylformylglycinamidine synthase
VKTYRVHVRVMPRAGLLDPAGQAVEHALTALGFPGATNVHLGKAIALDLERQRSRRHRAGARDAANDVLANPVTEDFTVEVAA